MFIFMRHNTRISNKKPRLFFKFILIKLYDYLKINYLFLMVILVYINIYIIYEYQKYKQFKMFFLC